MSKLLTPPHAHATATTSAEFENATDNFDDASIVIDESGSPGSFLDATIARTKQMGNTTITHVSLAESRECPSDDLDDTYIELDDDFITEAHATRDANAVKELLARCAVRYKLSPNAKFVASPINIRDKDYDFSLDLSYISIVEKEPFCGTKNESDMGHMNELSTLSNLFSDDIKLRTYFVAKIFPFSLKDAAKTWFNNLSARSIDSHIALVNAFFQKYFPASAQHVAVQKIFDFEQGKEEILPESWARFCSLIRACLKIHCLKMNSLIYFIMD
jgi:hypothetical protein